MRKQMNGCIEANCTYLLLVQAHQPVAHVIQHVQPRKLILVAERRVSEIHARNALVLPATAKCVLVIQQTQLLNDVVHYEVRVDLRLVRHMLLVGLTQLANLIYVEALIGIDLQHAVNQTAKFLAVSVCQQRYVTFTYTLEQLIKI